ncbi:MAG: hypothetical protein ACXWLI_00815 [Myxococcaceae bacterium]
MVRLATVHRVVILSSLVVCLGVALFGLTRPDGPQRPDWQALGITGFSVAILLGGYLSWFVERHRQDRGGQR